MFRYKGGKFTSLTFESDSNINNYIGELDEKVESIR